MPALCLMLSEICYAQNYAGIVGLVLTHVIHLRSYIGDDIANSIGTCRNFNYLISHYFCTTKIFAVLL